MTRGLGSRGSAGPLPPPACVPPPARPLPPSPGAQPGPPGSASRRVCPETPRAAATVCPGRSQEPELQRSPQRLRAEGRVAAPVASLLEAAVRSAFRGDGSPAPPACPRGLSGLLTRRVLNSAPPGSRQHLGHITFLCPKPSGPRSLESNRKALRVPPPAHSPTALPTPTFSCGSRAGTVRLPEQGALPFLGKIPPACPHLALKTPPFPTPHLRVTLPETWSFDSWAPRMCPRGHRLQRGPEPSVTAQSTGKSGLDTEAQDEPREVPMLPTPDAVSVRSQAPGLGICILLPQSLTQRCLHLREAGARDALRPGGLFSTARAEAYGSVVRLP